MIMLFDYEDGLVLRIDSSKVLIDSVFYKLYIKRYVKSVYESVIIFKKEYTYLDYKKIIDIFKNKGYEFSISNNLREYIDTHEMYVEKRYRLGVEIKNQDEKLSEQFNHYKCTVDSLMTRKLREKQMWDSFYMCVMKKSANFSVPGSGKTASVLGAYAFLKSKELVKRIVVVCPKNAFGSWIDEFGACFGKKEELKLFNIHSYNTTNEKRMGLKYESGGCNLILVNYEATGGVEEALLDIIVEKTLLVFDEVHKVKRVGGEYASHALALAKKASYVIAMTGTPIPNGYIDIYNLLHILFHDEYDTFFKFSTPMLKNPSAKEIELINDKLQPFFCRTTKDELGVPKANQDEIYPIIANENENKILKILQMKYRKNKLALFIRLLQLETNPKMLLNTLNLADFQYLIDDTVDADEIDFADYSEEIQKLINENQEKTKFNKCVKIAQALASQGKTAIIWCIFVDSINRLSKELENLGIKTCCVYGEVSLEDRLQLINDFKSGKYQVLLTNPHTLAESVSLHSVCHDAIYYEYSYNLVHLLQSKDRIHRLGLPEEQYTQYHYLQLFYDTDNGAWSLNEQVYDRLKEKEKTMLDAIDNHVLETMPTSQQDLDLIFNQLTSKE